MPRSNTFDRTIDLSMINWDAYESEDYKLVLVGVKEVEKNLLKRFHYRNVPDFKALPDKSIRYCVLLLENKFISGKYEGEITYFESDAYNFRAIALEKSRVDFFKEHNICSGTLDCKFDYFNIDEKFVLPSNVINGVFEYQDIDRKKVDNHLNEIVSEASQTNKCEKLENIIQMHAFVESIFHGRTEKYFPADERFVLKEESKRILSMNKILGTEYFERDLKYWTKILPKYFFSSSEGLKDLHLKDYQNSMLLSALTSTGLIVSSFVEFYYNKFNLGSASMISGSVLFWDTIFRAAHNAVYIKATEKLDNKPGIIGTAVDFVKFWKNIFWKTPEKVNK